MNTQTTAPAENQDFLATALAKSIQFCKQNRKPVMIVLVAIIVLIVGVSCYTTHTQQVNEASWAAYYNAQVAFLTQGKEGAFKELDNVAIKFNGTPAANYARLLKANILFSQDNFAQAADVYKELVNNSNETVRTEASLSYAAALQATKDYEGSIKAAKTFIEKNSKSFALPQAYLTLALSQELAGQKTEALESYKYLLEHYTKTYFGTFAKDKISQLQK